jgi:hypothetical protein
MEAIKEWNWPIAVATARYNASIVREIFSKWPTQGENRQPPIHEIIFCATNLAFATELYLKTACVAFGRMTPPSKHKLRIIYDNIPKFEREQILIEYKKLFIQKYNELDNGEIWLRLNDGPLPNDKRPVSLLETLNHYSTSYEDWRYIFALNKNAEQSNLRGLHYSRLMCLCEAIDVYLQSKFPNILRKNEIYIW